MENRGRVVVMIDDAEKEDNTLDNVPEYMLTYNKHLQQVIKELEENE